MGPWLRRPLFLVYFNIFTSSSNKKERKTHIMLGKTSRELTDEPVTLYFSLQVQEELFI
jgi:hypothetical protein